MTKFKVGDWVMIKEAKLRLHILEITENTCSAGTQVQYGGRIFIPSRELGGSILPVKDLVRYNEMEFEKYEQPKGGNNEKEKV